MHLETECRRRSDLSYLDLNRALSVILVPLLEMIAATTTTTVAVVDLLGAMLHHQATETMGPDEVEVEILTTVMMLVRDPVSVVDVLPTDSIVVAEEMILLADTVQVIPVTLGMPMVTLETTVVVGILIGVVIEVSAVHALIALNMTTVTSMSVVLGDGMTMNVVIAVEVTAVDLIAGVAIIAVSETETETGIVAMIEVLVTDLPRTPALVVAASVAAVLADGMVHQPVPSVDVTVATVVSAVRTPPHHDDADHRSSSAAVAVGAVVAMVTMTAAAADATTADLPRHATTIASLILNIAIVDPQVPTTTMQRVNEMKQ